MVPRLNRLVVLLCTAALVAGACAKKGLVSDEYPEQFYKIPRMLDDGPHDRNPRFLAYGDTQSGRRIKQKFAKKDVWWTWKAFIFPFYYIYNIGQGAVGTVNWVRNVPDYGEKERREIRDAVYAEVMETRPDFLMDLGDICMYDGRRPEHSQKFIQENRIDVPLLEEVAFVPVIGNHDRANDEEYGFPNFRAVFDYPRFYVLDFPDLAIFVLDSDFILDQNQHIDDDEQDELWSTWFVSPEGAQEPSWLERELASRPQKFKIVAMHHAIATVGKHFSDWTNSDYGRNLLEKRRRLIDLFFRENVQLLMAGHEHLYQHNTISRIVGDETSAGTTSTAEPGEPRVIHMLITSGGGAPIRSLPGEEEVHKRLESYRKDGFVVENVANHFVHHYSIVEVDDVDPKRLVINTVGVESESERPLPVLETITIEAN
jgi:3',5'-cyclic AMP phosphodiesterase CpdA